MSTHNEEEITSQREIRILLPKGEEIDFKKWFCVHLSVDLTENILLSQW
jgi:hypothetical protein